MPSVKRKVVVTPRHTLSKSDHPATLKPAKPVGCRYDQGLYPWDDYQDIIVVKSVEEEHDQDVACPLVGVEHYCAVTSQHNDYKHICVHFNEYRKIGQRVKNSSDTDDEDNAMPVKSEPHLNVEDTRLPTRRGNYNQKTYQAWTTNPAVFLAIARIAQRNIRFLDLTFALDHLPNHPPDQPLPKLAKGKFANDVSHLVRDSDIEFTIAFLPNYYEDARHALGFFSLEDDADAEHPTCVRARTCLFTPCTTANLEEYGLVQWIAGKRGGKIQVVGSYDGEWLCAEIVEDWDDWRVCEMVAGQVWENKVVRCRGTG
jgi:hypothetical protein